jgi:Ion channel
MFPHVLLIFSATIQGFIAWSTVGYGDLVLRSPAGRAIFILWALIGVGSLTILISVSLRRSELNHTYIPVDG